MPKQIYEIKDFSGGLNAYADPRDIDDKEFSQNWNVVVDKNGILRVVGSAVNHIDASNISNQNFETGFGLFQFAVDYGWNVVDGNFELGFEQGTVDAVTTGYETTKFTLEATPGVNITDNDYYKGMTVFFDSVSNADNKGDSRVITVYDASERLVTIAPAMTANITTSDTYKIYKWKSVDFTTGSAGTETDYITSGTGGIGYETTLDPTGESSDAQGTYYAVSKITGSDETSVSGGYLQYMGADETNLTLKAGVEYFLTFHCAASDNWHNLVCDGVAAGNAEGIAGWVPWVELYSASVTNTSASGALPPVAGVANVGLNLLANNFWVGGTVQTAFNTQANYNFLDDGKFENVSGGAWTSVNLTAAAASETSIYGGHDHSVTLTADAVDFSSNHYKSTAMTLPTETLFRLNFVYKSKDGLAYSVYDTADSAFLVNWTTLGTSDTANTDGIAQFEYPFQQYFNRPGTSADDTETDYIYFYVPTNTNNSLSGTTRTVEIRFSPVVPTRPVSIAGATVRKAYNDLITMSRTTGANPFKGAVGGWTKYTTTFKIPKEYNDASDWILRLHAGKWDYQNGNNLNQNSTQDVYFDNIKLSSSDGDVLTLLSNNEYANPGISIHSSNQGDTWNKGMISNYDIGGQFDFNYANGALRISDGNFNTHNRNKLMFFDKNHVNNGNYGWRVKAGDFLNFPPVTNFYTTFIFDEIEFEEEQGNSGPIDQVIGTFDGIDHMNDIFDGIHYSSPASNSSTGPLAVDTDWKYNRFGPNTSEGIVTRYFWSPHPTDDSLWDPPSQMLESGSYNASTKYHGWIPGNPTAEIDDQYHIAIAGWDEVSFQNGGGIGGGSSADSYGMALHPFKLLCTHEGMEAQCPETLKNASGQLDVAVMVNKVSYEIYFEYSGYYRANNTGSSGPYMASNCTVPYFHVRCGRLSSGINGTSSSALKDFIDSGDTQTLSSVQEIYHGRQGHNDGYSIQDVLDGTDGGTYSSQGTIEITENYNEASNHRAQFKFKLTGTLSFPESGSGRVNIGYGGSNDLVMYVSEYMGEGDNALDLARCLSANIFRFADTNGDDVWGLTNMENGHGTAASRWSQANEMQELGASAGGNQFATFTRYFVHQFDVDFWSTTYTENLEDEGEGFDEGGSENGITVSCTNTQVAAHLEFDTPNNINASGWAERKLNLGISTVNLFDEESHIRAVMDGTDYAEHGPFSAGQCPDVNIYIGDYYRQSPGNEAETTHTMIKQTKFYMKDGESDIWYLQWYYDHAKGELYSITSGKKFSEYASEITNVTLFKLDRADCKDFNEVDSYEKETLVSQNDGLQNHSLTCRWKTSVIANNRLFVGNIMQNGKIYGDRMLKSPPNKYNVLPASNFIDIAINDGDEITALAYYKDKILQFKKQKVFSISISGDFDFLEDTFQNVGVLGQFSVTTTPHGVVWANKNGCYMFDGKELTNLIEGKIPTSQAYANPGASVNRWCANASTGDCVIGYDRKKDTVLVNFTKANTTGGNTPSGATYHFPTKSWSLIFGVWNDAAALTATGNMSNMITNTDGDILFYHVSSTQSHIDQNIRTLRKWDHEANDTLTTKNIRFTTKDITFGDINVRKKIYAVYITYRVRSQNTDSGISVFGAINGSNDFDASSGGGVAFSDSSKFAYGQTNTDAGGDASPLCYVGSTLDETDTVWKTARLVPLKPGLVNNISSFMLQCSGAAPYDFEINDISISYRIKRIK